MVEKLLIDVAQTDAKSSPSSDLSCPNINGAKLPPLETLKKNERLRKRREFERIRRQCQSSLVGRFLVIDYCTNNLGLTRLGITVSRKFGDAVRRNRAKRLVREAFRRCKSDLPPGYDLNIRPRHAFPNASLLELQRELIQQTRRLV